MRWIVDQDTGFLSPKGIFYKAVACDKDIKMKAKVRLDDNIYYGSIDNINWTRLDRKEVVLESNLRDMMILLYLISYVVVWYNCFTNDI